MFKILLRKYAHQKSFPYIGRFASTGKTILQTEPEFITVENQYQVLQEAVAPLYHIPYEKQLVYKQCFADDVIKDLRIKVIGPNKKDLEVLPIVASVMLPVTEHYRNKDEYNVRMGVDRDPVTYGLFTGKPTNGVVYAVRPLNIPVIKPLHNEILKVFESYVKKSSLKPSYSLDDGGFWRRVIVRSNGKGETMLVIINHPQFLPPDEIDREEKNIVEHFASQNCHIDSIYHFLSKHVRSDTSNSRVSLIHGKPFLYENLLNYKFRISPDSFFQINIPATELLHREILNFAQLRETDTVLDLGCGVGTISIITSNHVRNCIGIDSSFSSVEDAIHNASINGIVNCQFIPGNIETRINPVMKSLDVVSNLVVIANPGRSGLHPRVIEILRASPIVKKIIYVSCKPDHLMARQNFIDLLKKNKRGRSEPFKLTKTRTVDMFPHTYHFEMILVFERS